MRVFVTRIIPEEGLRILRERFDVDVFPHERPITAEELLDGVRDADALLCLLTDRITPAVLDAAPRLKVIANYAVGYDNIDVREAAERGIVVTNTPGVLTEATADLAFALLIACARRIVEADRWLRANAFPGWSPMLFRGVDLAGK
ncbi:MAG: D-glycerate dehydrogenase, partial [Bacteroidota bacterium]|nr:D-glycerate dehydrogenase [Bacteroidota bacterium]